MKRINQLALSSLATLTMLGGFGAATASAKTTSYSHYVLWNKPTAKKYAVHYKNNKSVLLNHPYKTAKKVKKVHNMNNYKHTVKGTRKM
ncbi:MAG: hypothetical protein ABF657_11690 [Lentilactobacillus diolivorans]|uniref:hypothetical protein n=1 Tax=Lentilactobacillus diolivorans TaxID=179838 RepID=UPI0039E9D2C7